MSPESIVLETNVDLNTPPFPFTPEDKDWSGYHAGLSQDRRRRLLVVVNAMYGELEKILLKNHTKGLNIRAHVPIGVFSVAIKGDKRAYQPIVMLSANEMLSYDHLQKLSSEITNTIPVSRVIFRIDTRLKSKVI